MTITTERAELLAQYLSEDEKRARRLFETNVERAATLINKDGFDFTAEELTAFSELMENARCIKHGELSEDDLNNVNGGIIFTATGIATTVLYCAALNIYCCCARVWLASKSRKH